MRTKAGFESGANPGGALWCSSDALVSAESSAQCTGFSMSMPAHGMPSIIRESITFTVSSGQTYEAMVIPVLKTVSTNNRAT